MATQSDQASGERQSARVVTPVSAGLSRAQRFERWSETLSALLLGQVTIATAWSGYQAARSLPCTPTPWVRWLNPNELRPKPTNSPRWILPCSSTMSTPTQLATRTWPPSTMNASDPKPGRRSTPGWPLGRSRTRRPRPAPSRCPNTGSAWRSRQSSSMRRPAGCLRKGERPTKMATNISLNTLLLASVLFLSGIAPRFDWRPIVVAILVAAAILLVIGLYSLATLPVW